MKLWSQQEAAPWEEKGFPNSEHLEEVPPSLSGGRGSCMKMDNTAVANGSSGSAAMNLAQ